MMTVIFLDIDGVLNDHRRMRNGYSQLTRRCVRELAKILRTRPEARIVVSSAWRYIVTGIREFVILDDLPIGHPALIRTDGNAGLTPAIADRVIRQLVG